MDNVIYFPYIRVPQNRWFKQVLLYWDEIGSIVPTDFADNEGLLGRYMNELVREGLVRQIRPAYHISDIDNFGYAFLEYVKSNDYPITQEMRRQRNLPTINVHMEKLSDIGQELCRQGLARRTNHIWFKVESYTANLYMAYLAASLGELDKFRSRPITDESHNLYDITYGIHHNIEEMRTMILQDVLPVPNEDIIPKDIAEFKDEHGIELIHFRNRVERELIIANNIQDPSHRSDYIKRFIEDTQGQISEIQGIMRARGWRNIDGIKLISAIPPALLSILAAQRGDIPTSAIAALTSLLASYNACRDLRQHLNPSADNYAAYPALIKMIQKPPKMIYAMP